MGPKVSLFRAALRSMADERSAVFPPNSFQAYLRALGLPNTDTARAISIQSMEDLAAELRAENVMVFRLGCRTGDRNTHFALARTVTGWSDYFLIDNELFRPLQPVNLGTIDAIESLKAFTLLPKFTETSLVNLALASNLMHRALRLDPLSPFSVPATGQGTYTFEVIPHLSISERWEHYRGQVELDSVFVAPRSGKQTVFVVEAKAGRDRGSLAKHKLVYPMLALRGNLAEDVDIVGVYLRSWQQENEIHFQFAECQFEKGCHAVASLVAQPLAHYVLSRSHVV